MDSTHDLTVTRVFDAPASEVWKLWSDSASVRLWWGPTGFTPPSAELDFREGGKSLVCMRAPAEFGGGDIYNTWSYTKIQPYERIEFILNFADKDGTKLDPAIPGVPAAVPHVVTFNALGPNRTEMTVSEFGYATAEARDISKSGLEQCVDKMALLFD